MAYVNRMLSLVGNETDWLFMPDGSGSIIYPKAVSQMGTDGEEKIYGEDLSVCQYYFESVKQQINMPAFCVSKQGGGLFAAITSGAEQSSLCWNIGSSATGYSGIYPRFRLRGYSLEGFGENGIDAGEGAGGFTVASKLGGKSGLKTLVKNTSGGAKQRRRRL